MFKLLFISILKLMSKLVRDKIEYDDFIEIYVNAVVEICIKRDTRSMYKTQLQKVLIILPRFRLSTKVLKSLILLLIRKI